ncbi:MAG: carbohydrate ABC transporter substrate-binding protein [Oscillospiraceae bacterium]|nr:carbohydrate ABC transporter substrate-binding protein [Oscillospiraceae bacterium]
MKKIIALLLALVMVMSLAACGASEPAPTNAPKTDASVATEGNVAEPKKYEGVEITYWSMWSAGEPQALVIEEAAKAYEAETGAKVNIEWKGRDIKTLLSAALEAGEKFDVFDDDYTRIGQVYAPYTYDLTDMAAAAGYDKIGYACFNDQAIEWAGFLNSIVEQPNIGGIFYDKDAFAAAGIDTVPATWTEFLAACEKLKAAGIAPLALDSAYADFNVYHHLVRHLGEDKIKELSANGGWAADANAVAAAQEIIDFVNAGYLAEGAPDQYPNSQNKIGLGTAAMIVCADYVCAEVNNAMGVEINWGFMAFPTPENCADTSSYAGANSMAITKYSENAQAAFDFILYVVTGTYGQKLVDNCKQIPADVALTEATLAGSVAALQNTVKPMSWCGNIHADRNQGYKDLSTQIFEGKFADGAAWCAAMDALK